VTDCTEKPAVLVVDDEPRILDSIRDLLEENFEVIASTDGEEALQILRTAKFTVILADQRMPGLTGDQFLAKAQEISDATRILVTGYADIRALIRAVNHGQIFTYVAKPWEPAELKVTVFKAAAHARKLVEQKTAAETVARQQEALAQSEAILRQQTKILQSILDSMGDGVIVADHRGKMMLLNPAARQMIGPREDVPPAQWSSTYGIYCPDTMAPYPAGELPLAKALRGETVDGTEIYVRNDFRPDGAFLSVNGRPLKDDGGNAGGGVAVIRDITESKRSEDLLRKAKDEAVRANHAKSEFLSRMSHELRTPLNSILGFAQLLEMDALSAEQEDSLAHIMKGGQHLLSLINEVLDLARIEAGRLFLSPEAINLQEVIQDALAFVRPIAQQRNIQIRCDATIDTERHVKADQQRLRQVFLNLLSNAVKYNVESGRVDISCQAREGGVFRIAITDTGQGISEKHQERLFQPFERVGDESTGIEGTGLGLALSKGLMEAMGGRIGVESKLGQGSTFWIELNGVDSPEGALVAPLDEPNVDQRPDYSPHRTVLYVEDNRANYRLMERIVAHRKELRLIGAERGRAGLEMAGTHSPDLILLDLHLPDISGQEILDHLKDDPKTTGIPVVIVSADATPGQIDRLLASGADSYLTKPLDIASILSLFDNTFTMSSPLHAVDIPESCK
jgi:signal transduction histidine kinase/response regulator RpfG family c-di-GMP phosphodiesterase